MAGIGAVEVAIVAATSQFKGDLDKAAKNLQDFEAKGKSAADRTGTRWEALSKSVEKFGENLEHIGKRVEKLGRELSIYVTAPLVGISYAAIRAADVTKSFGEELIGLRNSASEALEPLGRVLIQIFEDWLPALQIAIGLLHELADGFAGLSPELQKTIVIAGLSIAVLGPLLLLAGGLVKTLGRLTVVITPLALGVAKLAVSLLPVLGYLLAIGAVLAALDFGKWAYDNFRPVQEAMAHLIAFFQDGWTMVKSAAVGSWLSIKKVALETMDAILVRFNSLAGTTKGFLAGMMDAVTPGSGNAVRAIGAAGEALHASLLGSINNVDAELIGNTAAANSDIREHAATLAISLKSIADEFGNAQSHGQSFAAHVLTDLKAVASYLPGFIEGMAGTPGLFTALGAMSSGVGAKATAFAKAQGLRRDEFSNSELNKQALAIQKQVYPIQAYEKDLENLRKMKERFPEIIDDRAFHDHAEKIRQDLLHAFGVEIVPEQRFREAMERLERLRESGIASAEEIEKAHRNLVSTLITESDSFGAKMFRAFDSWSGQITSTLADLATKGKASFHDLFASFLRMLTETAIKAQIVEPLVRGLGAALGGAIGGLSSSGDYGMSGSYTGFTAGMNRPHAKGAAYAGGRLMALAAGGLALGPTLAPVQGGTALFGEKPPGEAIMPLSRMGGVLGVKGSPPIVIFQVIDQRKNGTVTQERATGPNGETILRAIVRDEFSRGLADGMFDRALFATHGVSRRAAGR